MKLVREAISANSETILGLKEYKILVVKIEENIAENPDIAIECCKALIEGLCLKALSLLSADYNSSKSIKKKCSNDFPYLTNMAFGLIYANSVELQLHESLVSIINDVTRIEKLKEKARLKLGKHVDGIVGKIAAVRHDRGDISHGRNYPKVIESSIHLARSISSITDGVCSYMIRELATQYRDTLEVEEKMPFAASSDFNQWLDVKFSSSTINLAFSSILYEHAYEKYLEFYYTEFLPLEESESEIELTSELIDKLFSREKNKKVAIRTEASVNKLVNDFDKTLFWTDDTKARVETFAYLESLEISELKNVMETYLFSGMKPLRDEVAKAMKIPPALKDRQHVLDDKADKIVILANELNVNNK